MLAPLNIPKSFAFTQSNKVALFAAVIIIAAMIADISLARVYDLISKAPTSSLRFIIFSVITIICIIGQYFFMSFVGHRTTYSASIAKHNFRAINWTVRLSQYTLAIVLIVLMLQIYATEQYHTFLLLITIWISYGMAIFSLGVLAERFLSWHRAHKNPVIILYALAAISLSVNLGFTLVYVYDIVVDRPQLQKPYSGGSMPIIKPGSVTAALNSGFFISSIISFALLWGSTAMLLHHYSSKLGVVRYWMVIASPLLLFLAQFISLFIGLFDPLISADPVSSAFWLMLIFTLSKPVGGILFAMGFFSIVMNFRQDAVLRNYLIISAFGFVTLFVANQASVLIVTPYPPFGVPTVSFVGFASYMILVGIYSSAISISEDVKLRQFVRKTAADQSKLLESIGTAAMTEDIQNRVIKIRRVLSDEITEVTGSESLPSEDDLKSYVEEVVNEISKKTENNRS